MKEYDLKKGMRKDLENCYEFYSELIQKMEFVEDSKKTLSSLLKNPYYNVLQMNLRDKLKTIKSLEKKLNVRKSKIQYLKSKDIDFGRNKYNDKAFRTYTLIELLVESNVPKMPETREMHQIGYRGLASAIGKYESGKDLSEKLNSIRERSRIEIALSISTVFDD